MANYRIKYICFIIIYSKCWLLRIRYKLDNIFYNFKNSWYGILCSNSGYILLQQVLTDFSLTVPGGRMVALVGLSGGGEPYPAYSAVKLEILASFKRHQWPMNAFHWGLIFANTVHLDNRHLITEKIFLLELIFTNWRPLA